jgi:microcystin-dependent protein
MWSGSIATIPTGWVLCDGTNSTPDLRNRFVVGAGSTYAVNATGGSADATLPTHTHTATVIDTGHLHTFQGGSNTGEGAIGSGGVIANITTLNTASATTGITVTNASTGVSGTNANLPPYFALAYIMKA